MTSAHFLGRGWSFPPTFRAGGVRMTADEEDVECSLRVLFSTAPGERLMRPDFGVDMRELLFEPLTTTARNLLYDRIETTIAVHEARIRVLELAVDDSEILRGRLTIRLDYCVRSTNSRFNLVFPFYFGDANEMRASVGGS